MKILLNLNKSFNNYDWKDKEELKQYIYDMLEIMWEYYQDYIQEDTDPSDEIHNRFYNLLDMFSSFEVLEKGVLENDKNN